MRAPAKPIVTPLLDAASPLPGLAMMNAGIYDEAAAWRDWLQRAGIELHLGAMVTDVDPDGVELTRSDGTHLRIAASTKVWAAGTRASCTPS